MSAPVAMQPAAANDGRAARPVAFQTKASAEAHALRSARQQSPTRMCSPVEFVDNAYRAAEGGAAFQVKLGVLDWEVLEHSATEVERLVQAGIRREIGACEWRATAHDGATRVLRSGSATYEMHVTGAKRERSRLRELELLLTVSVARDDTGVEEPITSSERDSRYAESR